MSHEFLPISGVYWLCSCFGSQVVPLTPAPGEPDAKRRFAKNGFEFGVMDQSGKRVGHYRVLDSAPWFEKMSPPGTLPKGAHGHALMVHEGMLIAGGRGDYGEALWIRQTDQRPHWVGIKLPDGVTRRRGSAKAIDALFVYQNELVADNIARDSTII